jgi:cold shock CspA family protein
MAQGTIQGIQIALGLGSIRPDDGTTDLLFHRDALGAGAFEELREGMWVTFEAAPDPRNPAHRLAQHLQLVTE